MSTNFSWRYIPYYIFKCVAHHSVLLNNFCIWMLLTLHVLFCQSYIVYLGSHSFRPNPSSIDVESVTMSHYDLLESYVGRYIEFNPKFMKFFDVKTNIFLCLWFFFFYAYGGKININWLYIFFLRRSTEKAQEAIFYSYKRYINGFAAILNEDEAANVSSM